MMKSWAGPGNEARMNVAYVYMTVQMEYDVAVEEMIKEAVMQQAWVSADGGAQYHWSV